MTEDTCPVQWTGRQAVVTPPRDIDSSNADQIRERLLWVISRGAGVLVADRNRPSPAITPARMRWHVLIAMPLRTGPSAGWWLSLTSFAGPGAVRMISPAGNGNRS